MHYAKIDTQTGEVIEFPFRDPMAQRQFESGAEPLPADVVQVDTEANRPAASWDEKLMYDGVTQVGSDYVLNYTVEPRFTTTEQKRAFVETQKKYRTEENKKRFESIVDQIVSYVPQREAESWDQQVLEARQWTADNTATVPLITAAATARGVTVAQYCEAILRKAGEYAVAYGTVLGKFHRNQDVLDSIDLADELTWNNLNNYDWTL